MLEDLTPRPPSLNGKGVPIIFNRRWVSEIALLPPSLKGRGAGEVRS